MSIGAILTQARGDAGLSVAQVSERTRVRETIIRGIERDDYSACGGDFYARGHIRSIARVVGTDPAPLIEEYDATLGAPEEITAAEALGPAMPIRAAARRRPNWTAILALAHAGVCDERHREEITQEAADQLLEDVAGLMRVVRVTDRDERLGERLRRLG